MQIHVETISLQPHKRKRKEKTKEEQKPSCRYKSVYFYTPYILNEKLGEGNQYTKERY